MKLLLDTNVILDVLLARQPFLQDAASLVALVEQQKIHGYLCATTVTTIGYLMTKEKGPGDARTALRRLLNLFHVTAVNHAILGTALDSPMKDFEDAVLHEAARSAGIDGIITRNVKDFSSASLPVYLPREFLAAYHAGESET